MTYFILGFKKVNYTNKNTGNVVDGNEIYICSATEDDSITAGQLTEKLFLSRQKFDVNKSHIGKEIRLVYSLVGGSPRLTGIEVL